MPIGMIIVYQLMLIFGEKWPEADQVSHTSKPEISRPHHFLHLVDGNFFPTQAWLFLTIIILLLTFRKLFIIIWNWIFIFLYLYFDTNSWAIPVNFTPLRTLFAKWLPLYLQIIWKYPGLDSKLGWIQMCRNPSVPYRNRIDLVPV